MAVKWETVKAGDVLYQSRRTKMGNTTLSTLSTWSVRIISIDHEKRRAVVSWNGNAPRTWFKSEVEKCRRSRPVSRRGRGEEA